MSSSITTILTKKSYPPIGHYSQAFRANGHIWVSGQIAADADGNLLKRSMSEQAHQICKNTSKILQAAGSSLEKTVKVTVFATDFSKLPEFNSVYNTYFPQKPPRSAAEVSRLPLDVEVMMEVVALVDPGDEAKL
ncbi:Endoribonuclease L-PSP/chorismate mutase-like protein [Aspergillus pseudoustus]|uniref:Endoribonuclease L-PSP/chorismate mutase-like protein n=1 Tax=Aspergillus pseudoustus TaxID=1810923 RepID=A0ABR4IRP2_9EURO